MSTNAGQALTPYPWSERKKFNDARRLIAPVVRVTRVLMYVATIFCPPSVLLWFWALIGFRRRNDSWAKRGLFITVLGGFGIMLFSPWPMDIVWAWDSLLRSFGPESTLDVQEQAINVVLLMAPYAVVIQGLHALARSFQIERTTTAFLKPTRPTTMARLRRRRNVRRLSTGVDRHPKKGYVRFGVIEDDRIPWRTSRYGMVVERKIERMGHGVFIGSNGTGKTKAAETFSHYVLSNDGAIIFIDFKASLSALRGLSAVARTNDVPCYILDIGFGSTDTSWYDLFAWPGSPADKASVLIECLQFPEGEGGTAYYRGIAEAWMPMQIEAAELVGLDEGEGMFDFLLDTAVPAKFQERIESLRESSDPEVRAKYQQWYDNADLRKVSELEGLRSEMQKIVNAAGHRLKPNAENPHPVSMKEVMDNGGMVYIGIAAGVNDVVVKVLGSFLFRELSILVSARSRANDPSKLRDVFVIPDEASEMEERSVMMNSIYTMAREARIFLWPSFQSFAVWDDSTRDEIQANTRNFVVFQIPERSTAAAIGETLPDIYALKQMSEESTRQQAFQEQTVGISGDARLEVVTDAFLRPNIELSQIPVHHAYIWFMDAPHVSRDRWFGRRRVRKDQNIGDAPLVKLVPHDLVMPENEDPGVEVHSDVPEVIESTVLPEAADGSSQGPSPAASAPGAAGGEWTVDVPDVVDIEEPAETEDAPPEEESFSPDDQASTSEAVEPSGPPALPAAIARRDARARKGAGDVPPPEASAGPEAGVIPPPAEDDDFTDDGADGQDDPGRAAVFSRERSVSPREARGVTDAGVVGGVGDAADGSPDVEGASAGSWSAEGDDPQEGAESPAGDEAPASATEGGDSGEGGSNSWFV